MPYRALILATGTLAVALPALAQTSSRPGSTTPISTSGRYDVTSVRLENGQVMVGAGGRTVPLPAGAFVNESGARLVVESGRITLVTIPAGGRITKYLGSPDTRPETSESRIVRTVTGFQIQATRMASGGALRLRTSAGEEYALPDGAYRAEGKADRLVMLWSGGKPVTLVLPIP